MTLWCKNQVNAQLDLPDKNPPETCALCGRAMDSVRLKPLTLLQRTYLMCGPCEKAVKEKVVQMLELMAQVRGHTLQPLRKKG